MPRDETPPSGLPEEGPPEEAPSGMPDEDSPEDEPLGVTEADPDGEGEPARGDRAMPGVPADGEPPFAS